MSEQKSKLTGGFVNIFAGAGIGLLVGMIVGLSVSPVVSVILGALASLLGAFLGLQDGGGGQTEADSKSFLSQLHRGGMKAGSFGFACVAGIIIGLFIRTNDVFSPSLETQINQWKQAGFEEEYARQLIVFQKFGIDPKTKKQQFTEIQKSQASVLFSDEIDEDLCYEISMERYDNPAEALKAYRRLDKPAFTNLADQLEMLQISDAERAALMTAIWEILCGEK